MNHPTTDDKGELLPRSDSQEAKDRIEELFSERDWPVNPNAAARCGWEAARRYIYNRHPTCEPRRTTNEGQDTLTDGAILTDAHRYCCKYVHADDAPYRFTERGIIEFVRLRIERGLNQRLAVKEGASCTSQEPHICRHHPDGNIAYQLAAELDELKDDQQAKDAARYVEALDYIGGLSRALRIGGPDPMDLQDLSDALEEAVNTAHAALSTTKQEEV